MLRDVTLKNITVVSLLSITFLFSNCYSYRVATHAQAGAESSKPITAHAYFWGLAQKPAFIHTPICDSLGVNGMSEVTMKTNYGYALITVFTLGIWSPMKVVWKCGKPCKKNGVI